MGYYRIINKVKWYYRLKPQTENNKTKSGLFSDTPRHTLTNALIVSLSYYDVETGKTYRLYTHFKSYLEYGIYQMKLPHHERCFYEIILGESAQKPHFDIDIDDPTVDGEAVKDNLIDSIIAVLKNIKLNLTTDVLLYTSHGANEKGTKQSYHVIVDNYCHANNVEAKAFYYKVIDNITSEHSQWIDRAVYGSLQQFRTTGSRKIGSERVKVFQKAWSYHDKQIDHEYPEPPDGPEHEFVMQLEASIVGFTGNCKFLPPFEPKPEHVKHYDSEVDDVSPDEANEAINLIGLAGNININDPRFPYKFMGINGPIVMLKRTKPSRCKICCRVHEHENPYLLVIGDERSVYFHCRRAPEGKSLFLGKLKPDTDPKGPEGTDPKEDEAKKIEQVKINWTKNVIEKVQKIARANNANDKKYISGATNINPVHKQQFIEMYVNTK